MPNQKVTEMPEAAAPSPTDLLYVVDDPAGVPVSRKATVRNVVKAGWGVNVVASTAGAGSPRSLGSADFGTTFTNEGATAQSYFTLPPAAANVGPYTFVVQDADGIRVTAGTGDTIRIAGSVSAAAGHADSTTIGSVLTLVAVNANEWVAVSVVGTWGVT